MNLMGWDPEYRYKILGKLIRTQSTILFVFDLTSAETFVRKKADDAGNPRRPLYPEEWKTQFGIPVKEHQDMTLVSIFDDYTVFRIDKDEEREGKKTDGSDDNAGYEEKQASNTSENDETDE